MAGCRNCCLNRVILTDAQYAAQSNALNSQYAESRREKGTTPIFTSFFAHRKLILVIDNRLLVQANAVPVALARLRIPKVAGRRSEGVYLRGSGTLGYA